MHLDLSNYVVGLGSFWNLVAPAIAMGLFVIGLIVVAVSSKTDGVQPGLVIAAIGVVVFVIAVIGDEVGNAHDVGALESAVHQRYGLNINYATSVALFGSNAGTQTTVSGRTITLLGSTDLDVHGTSETVALERLSDGTYILASNGKDLPANL